MGLLTPSCSCSHWDVLQSDRNRPQWYDWSRGWESYLPKVVQKLPGLKLSIENLNIGNEDEIKAASIFPGLLRSCKARTGPKTFGLHHFLIPDSGQGYRISDKFRDMLYASTNLETLHLIKDDYQKVSRCASCPTFSDDSFQQGKRLPAVSELVLYGYNWCHSPTVTNEVWNW